VLVGSLVIAPVPATADQGEYPVSDWVIPNGLNHSYCFNSSVPTGQSRSIRHDVMSYMDTSFDHYDTYSATCTDQDIVFLEGSSTSGARGSATCVSLTAFVCNQFWLMQSTGVIFSESYFVHGGTSNFGPNYTINYRKTLCHEVAHTLGLDSDEVNTVSTLDAYRDCSVSGLVPTDFVYISHSVPNRLLVNYFW
jgi:hypothetical protein